MARFSFEDGAETSSKRRRLKLLSSSSEEEVDDVEEDEEAEEKDSEMTVTIDHDVLDCTICFEPLHPPLYQCRNGHVACSSCCDKLSNTCHICSDDIKYSRCIALEKVIESIKVSCSNVNYGCRERISYVARSSHEETCIYSPCFCPIPGCTFSGSSVHLSIHVSARHQSKVKNFKYNESFEVYLVQNELFIVLQGHRRDLFLLVNKNTASGNSLSMVCIQPSVVECEFEYELTVKGKEGSLHLKATMTNINKWTGIHSTSVFLLVPATFFNGEEICVEVCVQRKE